MQAKRTTERRHNAALDFLKSWWFLIGFTITAVGVVATLWRDVDFMRRLLNPDSVIQYRTEEAVKDAKRQFTKCLYKAAIRNQSAKDALECAD